MGIYSPEHRGIWHQFALKMSLLEGYNERRNLSFGKEALGRAHTCVGDIKVLLQHWPIVISDDFILGLLWYF